MNMRGHEFDEQRTRYTELLHMGRRFNRFLTDNQIKSIEAFPETLSMFLGLCEQSRMLNEQSPPAMKGIWLCFGHWSTDCGKNAEIVLKLKLDGPLSDRDNWLPKFNRKVLFADLIGVLNTKYPAIEKAESFIQIDWQDQPEAIQAEACVEMAEMIRSFVHGAKAEMKILNFCRKASPDQILKHLLAKGRLNKIDSMCRFFEDDDEDLVLINQTGHMGAVRLENNKVVAGENPEWLNGLVLYRENRKIGYGDKSQNFKVDYHADKHKFKNVAKASQRNIFNSRQAQRKRTAEYYDTNENRTNQGGRPDNMGYNTRDEDHEVGYTNADLPSTSQWAQ